MKLLRCANAAAGEYGQPPLYETSATMSPVEMKRQDTIRRLDNNIKRVRVPDESLRAGVDAQAEAEKKKEDGEMMMTAACHVSIGWALKAPENGALEKLKSRGGGDDGEFGIRVESVKVKMGNGISVIALSEKRDSSNGIIER